jgi:hypothetical protein
MTVAELTKRVESLEREIRGLKDRIDTKSKKPWWKALRGRWANDPIFDEVVELGRKYRESLRPGRKRKKRT